jgi:hypothetical protein
MNRFTRTALLAGALTILIASTAPVLAQDRPYSEGVVVNVSDIRTLPGQFENYMNYIFGDYARLMEALKAEGLILDWAVYTEQPNTPDGRNVILTTAYPNMAAFDNLQEREAPILGRVFPNYTLEQSEAGFAARESMRTLLGSRLIRRMNVRQ